MHLQSQVKGLVGGHSQLMGVDKTMHLKDGISWIQLQGEAGSSKEVGEGDVVISMVAMDGEGELLHNQCPPALAANPSTFSFV
jgi:molybdopterin-guanine dinucleotide biosynthesis protein A